MKTYKEIILNIAESERREIFIAQLDQLGYNGFEEDGDVLKAYIPDHLYDESELQKLFGDTRLIINTIGERNWNAEWESSFSPVIVDELVAVRADFHEPVKGVRYEIVITPKMSFGTGHHATTWLMMRSMQYIDLRDRSVLDFGTGTGVLAILAEKMGAASVLAIDNDEWSVENSRENIGRNHCRNIQVELMDRLPEGDIGYDVILANINKHILLQFCDEVCSKLNEGGHLLLSGVLHEDLPEISAAYSRHLGEFQKLEEKNNWLMIAFYKGYSVDAS